MAHYLDCGDISQVCTHVKIYKGPLYGCSLLYVKLYFSKAIKTITIAIARALLRHVRDRVNKCLEAHMKEAQ